MAVMIRSLMGVVVGLVVAGMVTAGPSKAATITVGHENAGDCTFPCATRLQQVYSSDFFSGPVQINRVDFFVSGRGLWDSEVWQMSLSTSNNPVNNLSSTFSQNVGPDVNVFDTTITLTGYGEVGDVVSFHGDFIYDPVNGDLLIDLLELSGFNSGPSFSAYSSPVGVVHLSRLFSGAGANIDTPTGTLNNNYGILTAFDVTPVPPAPPIPLPAALPLFLTGLALVGAAAWKRRRAARIS